MSADSDFQARRTAPGVILTNGFDSDAELALGVQEQAADLTVQSIRDTSQKASGASSLRFRLRAGITTANIGGAWTINSPSNFVSGDDLYVQYRQRVDAQWLVNAKTRWNSSYKSLNVHGQTTSCQSSEFVVEHGIAAGGNILIDSYHDCGTSFQTSVVDNSIVSSCPGDCLIQQGSQIPDGPGVGYNCHYQNQFAGGGNGNGCLYTPADTWFTLYYHIHLGTLGGTANNLVEGFIAFPDGAYRQWQRCSGWTWALGGDAFLNRIRLETYMTELPGRGLAALADGFMWFDEFILSRQPIAAPSSGVSSVVADRTPLAVITA